MSNADDYGSTDARRLLAKAAGNDELAIDALCDRYSSIFGAWIQSRFGDDTGSTRVDQSTLDVLSRLRTAIHTVAKSDLAAGCEREASLLFALRQAMLRCGGTTDQEARDELTSSPRLDEALGGSVIERYEASLLCLEPIQREAIVCRLEMHFDFEQLAGQLGLRSAREARETFDQAFVHLARQVAHEF